MTRQHWLSLLLLISVGINVFAVGMLASPQVQRRVGFMARDHKERHASSDRDGRGGPNDRGDRAAHGKLRRKRGNDAEGRERLQIALIHEIELIGLDARADAEGIQDDVLLTVMVRGGRQRLADGEDSKKKPATT